MDVDLWGGHPGWNVLSKSGFHRLGATKSRHGCPGEDSSEGLDISFRDSRFKRLAERSHTAQRQPRLVVWIVFGKKFRDDFAAFPNKYWFAG
jgi:hypothetical protein